ncbi:Aldehyde oxidase, partial [Ophiophagus hannah]
EAINHDSFLAKDKKIERGDVEKAFQTVDKIIEGEVHIGGQEHFYLETNSVCVSPRKEDNTMDIYVSTQDAAHVQNMVASVLDVQSNKIMCHTKRVGGSFGGKTTKPPFFAAAAAVAAKKTGCPVRFILERQDDMLIVGGRHPLYGKYKVGFMKDGKIKAVDLLIFINGGCTPDESEMIKAAHEESISLSATGFFKGYVVNMDWEKGEGHAFPYFIFAASCSEAEIDCLTGDHKNLRTDIVIDGSFSINPGIDIGQGLGESGVFLGSSVFFAIRDAVGAARKERGLNSVFTLDSPLNVERIRMACADYFTEMQLCRRFF